MQTYLVFQHADGADLGSFRALWSRRGVAYHEIRLDREDLIPSDLSSFDALIALGGDMNVWETNKYPWLIEEISTIRTWVLELKMPFLGICLGHQLLAQALGGKTERAAISEKGLVSTSLTEIGRKDPLLKDLPDRFDNFQWHGAEVTTLPYGAELLASSEACKNQILKFGSVAYGFQAHIEIDQTTVDDWSNAASFREDVRSELGKDGLGLLKKEVSKRMPTLSAQSLQISDRFFELVAMEKERRSEGIFAL